MIGFHSQILLIKINKSEILNPKYETNSNDKNFKFKTGFENLNFEYFVSDFDSSLEVRRTKWDIRISDLIMLYDKI